MAAVRDEASVAAGDVVEVDIGLDTAPREVLCPTTSLPRLSRVEALAARQKRP